MPFSEDHIPDEGELHGDTEVNLSEVFGNVLDSFVDRQSLIKILKLAYKQNADWLISALNSSKGNTGSAVELVSDALRAELKDILTEFVNSRGAEGRKGILRELINNFTIANVNSVATLAADIYIHRLSQPSDDSFPKAYMTRLNKLS